MQNHENTQQNTSNKSSGTTGNLSSELNNIIFQEESRHAAHLSQAQQNAHYDFESIKKQIKFIVSEKAYATNPDGSHTVTVMHPQYPNTILRCYASEYLTMKTEQCKVAIGKSFLTRSYTTGQSLYCRVTDSEAFEAYKEELTKLCNKENISYKIVATPTSRYSSTLGLSSAYAIVPGCIESGKTFIANTYHIRILASMTF